MKKSDSSVTKNVLEGTLAQGSLPGQQKETAHRVVGIVLRALQSAFTGVPCPQFKTVAHSRARGMLRADT